MTVTATSVMQPFAEGMAATLGAVSGFTWDPTGAYDPTVPRCIYLMNAPDDAVSPVVLTPYPLADDPALSDSTIGLQVRTRSAGRNIRDLWNTDDAIDDALLGLYPVTLPSGIAVTALTKTSTMPPIREDGSLQRWWHTANHTALIYRPSTHRL